MKPNVYCVDKLHVVVRSGSYFGTDANSDSCSINANGIAPAIRSGSLCEVTVSPPSDSVLATPLTASVLTVWKPAATVAAAATAAPRRRSPNLQGLLMALILPLGTNAVPLKIRELSGKCVEIGVGILNNERVQQFLEHAELQVCDESR